MIWQNCTVPDLSSDVNFLITLWKMKAVPGLRCHWAGCSLEIDFMGFQLGSMKPPDSPNEGGPDLSGSFEAGLNLFKQVIGHSHVDHLILISVWRLIPSGRRRWPICPVSNTKTNFTCENGL